jgi:hypothetical protein
MNAQIHRFTNARTMAAVAGALLLGVVTALTAAVEARAQSGGGFELTWSTIDGGSYMSSTGGGFSLSGTVGQPDSGSLSSEGYSLEGGFWPVMIAPSSGGAPTLYIQRGVNAVVISWAAEPAGFYLESSTNPGGGTWTAAPTGNPVIVPVMGSAQFYRLKKP